MKPLLLPYIFNILVLIPCRLDDAVRRRGGQTVDPPGQVAGECRDAYDLRICLHGDCNWLGKWAVPPGLDVTGTFLVIVLTYPWVIPWSEFLHDR